MSEILLWITIGVLVGYVIGKIEFMIFKRKKCSHGTWSFLPPNEYGEEYIKIHLSENEDGKVILNEYILLKHDELG